MKLRKCFIVLLIICSMSMLSTNILANPGGENTFIENVFETGRPVEICRRGSRSRTYKSTPSRTPSRKTPSKTITKTKNKNTTRSIKKKTNTTKKTAANVKKTKKTAKKPAKKTKRNLSKADKRLAEKAKKSGNHYKDRKSATSGFKAKNAGKYSSKYTSKPTTRPSHIPQSTRVGNVNINVGYNSIYGGYGYMHLGAWVMYNAMADTIMVNTLMQRQGVFIASERGTVVTARPYYYSPWGIIISLMFLLLFVWWFITYVIKNTNNDWE